MSSQTIFIIMFFVFVGVLLGGSAVTRKWATDSSGYMLAGRQIGMLVNIFAMCAIGFAGTTVAQHPAFGINYGLPGMLSQNVVFLACGYVTYALLFGKFIRRCGAQTVAEWMEMRFGSGIRLVVTIVSVFGLICLTTNNILSMATNVASYTGWPQVVTLSICFFIILFFAFMSGMWAVTVTDFLQMVICFIAVPTLLISLLNTYGGFSILPANWPMESMSEGLLGTLSIFGITYPSMLTVGLPLLVWASNYYWIRMASCRTEKVAKWSMIVASLVLLLVVYVPVGSVGLYAMATNSEVFLSGEVAATGAYGFMMRNFSPILGALLMIAVTAASISTATTTHMGATNTAVRDIYQKRLRPNASSKELLAPTRIIMIVIAVFAWLLCYYPGGPLYLFPFAITWLGPPLVTLVLGVYWPRMNKMGARLGIGVGLITVSLFSLLDLTKIFSIGNYIYAGLLGLIVTLVFSVIGALIGKPDYYASPDWDLDPNARKSIKTDLADRDIEVLRMLACGVNTMADVTDMLQVDSSVSAPIIEKLDKGGYLGRAGKSGANFYQFEISDKGISAISFDGNEKELAENGLSKTWLKVLSKCDLSVDEFNKFAMSDNLDSMQIGAIVSVLTQKKYVAQQGVFRRRLKITQKGYDVMARFTALLDV